MVATLIIGAQKRNAAQSAIYNSIFSVLIPVKFQNGIGKRYAYTLPQDVTDIYETLGQMYLWGGVK